MLTRQVLKSGCPDEKAQKKSWMINISEKVAEKPNDNSKKVLQWKNLSNKLNNNYKHS